MCVKLSPENLNSGSCPPHSTNTYSGELTIAPKVCSGSYVILELWINLTNFEGHNSCQQVHTTKTSWASTLKVKTL